MWEEKIICPYCGKETFRAPFCRFCGRPIDLKEMETRGMKEVLESSSERKGEDVEEIIEKAPPQEVSEERRIIEQIANLYNWRHKLIELFLNGEAHADVFIEIYKEYHAKIQSINARRIELIKTLEQKINELTTRLEQLKVRHEVGEISDRQYITDKLAIDRELSKLRPKLNMLYNVSNVKLADIPEYEGNLRRFKDEIDKRGESLGLSREDIEMIINDLNETLESLKGLMELHKKLRKELDKIELRYRIGELTEEEYQAAKQKIERQMQL
ncbi:MAG: SHOCT domain-containing protein [Nitrososphaeria archaeon]|nr:SHOCT domain-containing protein [Nitrososphaeria archaeon]